MAVKIHPSWEKVLKEEFTKEYFITLTNFVKSEYKTETVYPAGANIFNAFEYTPFDQVKVVVLGQDPYHGEGQAHGLSFSVPDGVKPPPSLVNIYKEIKEDLGKDIPASGNLERWAKQGVLMLNATLTVRAKSPGSHQNQGWEQFTDAAIKALNERRKNIVYMLWGAYAQKKGEFIDREENLVLEAAHPSPFSAHNGFFGCKHFSQANKFLILNDIEPIDW
ncbi:MAG: uracil-DNA glycosylase [Candidatus Dojkabacteria bacterium]|nr:MAG: uracil-DNA glycosylase [Candidatus Dojkabacteria bacterium]